MFIKLLITIIFVSINISTSYLRVLDKVPRNKFLSALFAFLVGGIILNILKEELPEERKSNFRAFSLGAIAYSILLLFT